MDHWSQTRWASGPGFGGCWGLGREPRLEWQGGARTAPSYEALAWVWDSIIGALKTIIRHLPKRELAVQQCYHGQRADGPGVSFSFHTAAPWWGKPRSLCSSCMAGPRAQGMHAPRCRGMAPAAAARLSVTPVQPNPKSSVLYTGAAPYVPSGIQYAGACPHVVLHPFLPFPCFLEASHGFLGLYALPCRLHRTIAPRFTLPRCLQVMTRDPTVVPRAPMSHHAHYRWLLHLEGITASSRLALVGSLVPRGLINR